MEAGDRQRHVGVQTERQAHGVRLRDRLDALDVGDAIHHQGDVGAAGRRLRDIGNVLLVETRVADQQIVEPLRRQPDGLTRGEAHQALDGRAAVENAAQDGDAAHRLRGDTHTLACGASHRRADVGVEQVEVHVGERHTPARECRLILRICGRGDGRWPGRHPAFGGQLLFVLPYHGLHPPARLIGGAQRRRALRRVAPACRPTLPRPATGRCPLPAR